MNPHADDSASIDVESLVIAAAGAIEQGDWTRARTIATRLLEMAPDDPEGLLLLGLSHAGAGAATLARPHLERAVELDPKHAEAWASLGEVRLACGDPAGAATAAERAWREHPHHEGLARRAATLLTSDDRIEQALAPAEMLAGLGGLSDRIRLAELLESLDRIADAAPILDDLAGRLGSDPELTLRRATVRLPLVPGSIAVAKAAVDAFDHVLVEAETPAGAPSEVNAASSLSAVEVPPWPFRLAALADPSPDRARRHGELVRRAAVGRLGEPRRSPSARRGTRRRVGLIAGLWRDHVVARLFLDGWTRHLDRDRFEIEAIDVGRVRDEFGRSLLERCDAVWRPEAPDATPRSFAASIAERNLDVLLFPEVGMAPWIPQLAGLRLAPVQAVAWGHPETTGLPTIDLFLSSAAMEPPDAARCYTERLVPLPGLGASVSRPPLGSTEHRARIGWPEDALVCWCAQMPHKHAPQFDRIYATIAAAMPRALFVYSTPATRIARRRFEERIRGAFADCGADPDRQIEFMTTLPTTAFRARLAAADLFLDPPGWSGGHTALEAVAAGLPILTLPGAFMRRRHALGILRVLDPRGEWSPPLIAGSEEEYIERAIALASDATLRATLASRIVEHADRAFDDPAPIRALESVLLEAVSAR